MHRLVVQDSRGLVVETLLVDDVPAGGDSRRRELETGVVPGLQVGNEVPSAPECTAADVQHLVRGAQSVLDQVAVLQIPELVPLVAHCRLGIFGDPGFCMLPIRL